MSGKVIANKFPYMPILKLDFLQQFKYNGNPAFLKQEDRVVIVTSL
jgi:hypothetical protein